MENLCSPINVRKGRDHLGNPDVDGEVIVEWILVI
jgi:hypothetical protein